MYIVFLKVEGVYSSTPISQQYLSLDVIKYVGADKHIHLRTVVYSIYGKNHRNRHLNNDAANRKWQ